MSKDELEQALFDHERRMGRIPNNAPYISSALIGPNHKPPGYHREQNRQILESTPADIAKVVRSGLAVAATFAERKQQRMACLATQGWKPDPTTRFAQRWWDGFRWTRFAVDRDGTQIEDARISAIPGRPPLNPPNWYADPTGRYLHRYWDGLRWTSRVSTGNGDSAEDAVVVPSDPRAVRIEEGAWAPDPLGLFSSRWWDGTHWTTTVRRRDGEIELSELGLGLLEPAETWPTQHPDRFSGVGSDIVTAQSQDPEAGLDLLWVRSAGVIHVTGLDINGQDVGSLVSSTGPYDGVTVVRNTTRYLRLATADRWTAEILPIYPFVTYLAQDRPTEGIGDRVLVNLGEPAIAMLRAESDQGCRFSVLDEHGRKEIVNADGHFEGRVPLPPGIIELISSGRWSINLGD